MDIERYRIYRNKPKPLMGYAIVYYISNVDVENFGGEAVFDQAILEKNPKAANIQTVRIGCWSYKGVETSKVT